MAQGRLARRPLLLLAASYALGALVEAPADPPAAWRVLGASAALLTFGGLGGRLAPLALAAAAAGLGAGGAATARLAYERAPLRLFVAGLPDAEAPLRLLGRAAADARDGGDVHVLLLDVEAVERGRQRLAVSGRVRLLVGGGAQALEVVQGARISVWASLRLPRGFATPGAFDAEAQAFRDGVHAQAFCKSPLLLSHQPPEGGSLPFLLGRLRRGARAVFAEYLPRGIEEALVRAMVLGDRSGVDRETSEAFRTAGTYHVLAISGAQVALLAAALLLACRRAGLGPAPSALVISASLGVYAAFVGGDTPVVRAAVMAATMVLGRALDLDGDLANLLGLAALALLAFRPAAVGDVGFQLSFVATLGILVLAPGLRLVAGAWPLGLGWALAASLAAQLALLPLLALRFHQLAPAALLLNLAAGPLASAVLFAGLLLLAAACVSSALAQWVAVVAWGAASLLVRSGTVVAELPWLEVRVPDPAWWAVLLHCCGLVLIARGRLGRGGLLAALGALAIALGTAPPVRDGRLHLTLLDVGQGDALVLRSPHGRVWLVDAGIATQRFDAGEAVVGPYLWRLGLRRIEGLLLTHAHPDHVGGAPFLAAAFRARAVVEGVAPRHDASYARLDRALSSLALARASVRHGARLDWDGVAIEVLAPRASAPPPPRARNDDSIVVVARLGVVRFLLTGDVEAASEPAAALPADVLKVAHHGSRTSTTPAFLDAVRPRLALVSAGARNPFGHPHAEVLQRLRASGALVLRTDEDGSVTVSTDGRRLWVRTARGLEARLR